MAVARKSNVSAKRSWFRWQDSRTMRRQRLKSMETATEKSILSSVYSRRQRRSLLKSSARQNQDDKEVLTSTAVPDLNQQGSVPLWLLRLQTIYRNSSVVTFLLVAATLAIYGWTVYSQQVWGQAFRKWQSLQRYERQLTTTNEVLKNKLAQEAQTSAIQLVSPSPSETIFLRPAPENANPTPANVTPNSQSQQQSSTPVGY